MSNFKKLKASGKLPRIKAMNSNANEGLLKLVGDELIKELVGRTTMKDNREVQIVKVGITSLPREKDLVLLNENPFRAKVSYRQNALDGNGFAEPSPTDIKGTFMLEKAGLDGVKIGEIDFSFNI